MRRKLSSLDTGWETLDPDFSKDPIANKLFISYAKLAKQKDESVLKKFLNLAESMEAKEEISLAILVLSDLAKQDWSIRVSNESKVSVKMPNAHNLSYEKEKDRVRNQELVKRTEQLNTPATRKFILQMERKRKYNGRVVSIHSLERNGKALSKSLMAINSLSEDKKVKALFEVIDPYVQIIRSPKELCEKTGFRLRDIWRYFRHTWSSSYTINPGRSMQVLIRDRAREYHPVIGILAVGSPVPLVGPRDSFIGWDSIEIFRKIKKKPTAEIVRWLRQTINQAIDDIYKDDFLASGIISKHDLIIPNKLALKRLLSYGKRYRLLQNKKKHIHESRKELANTLAPLFVYKRARALHNLLRIRMILNDHLNQEVSPDEFQSFASSSLGKKTIKQSMSIAKTNRLNQTIASITVCGAVGSYGPILGGKLVAMLATSPDVISAYNKKYNHRESVISSLMAGRPIIRKTILGYIETTSLYGVGSSQYNRVHIPLERLGSNSNGKISYLNLGRTNSGGTSQFSSATIKAVDRLTKKSDVIGNNVGMYVGGGTQFKRYKIKRAFAILGFPVEPLSKHGRQRISYGIPLIKNYREYLLGIDANPEYLYDMHDKEVTSKIILWWVERWLVKRIRNEKVLEQVSMKRKIKLI